VNPLVLYNMSESTASVICIHVLYGHFFGTCVIINFILFSPCIFCSMFHNQLNARFT
jgi:hypothetical protein